jgi:predicted lipid-binding transport protein (Tim44 family)
VRPQNPPWARANQVKPVPVQFQIVMFAIVAAVLLFMLYNVLGKKVGRQPQEDARLPQPAPQGGPAPAALTPGVDAATAAAVAGLKVRDPAFDPARFLEGARQAYETIVRGYASGDREALRPLLTPSVMTSFEAGIAAREARGEREQAEFLHTPRADLELATVKDDRAVAKVRFLAEMRSTVTPAEGEAMIEERRTAELWTFERTLGAADPNWALARVEPASA